MSRYRLESYSNNPSEFFFYEIVERLSVRAHRAREMIAPFGVGRIAEMSANRSQIICYVYFNESLFALLDSSFHVLVRERQLKSQGFIYGNDVTVAMREAQEFAVFHEASLI